MTNETLSDKIWNTKEVQEYTLHDVIFKEDVKEFIRKRRHTAVLLLGYFNAGNLSKKDLIENIKEIDKLAGEKLI